jgi:ubiquinone/menaquinone biosynthesis C-methylase UbiE
MGWWLAPWYDRLLRPAEAGPLGRWRGELLAGASGRVLEIGAGTGANLPHYPDAVEHLMLCEPDEGMASRLREKLPPSPPWTVEVSSAPGEHLPADDASQDVVVSTLVLCTVADVDASLAELRRVLKPGGRFLFLEHVLDEDHAPRRAVQVGLTPVWKRVAGGCCLDRSTGARIESAGFSLETVEKRPLSGRLNITGALLWGSATRPSG